MIQGGLQGKASLHVHIVSNEIRIKHLVKRVLANLLMAHMIVLMFYDISRWPFQLEINLTIIGNFTVNQPDEMKNLKTINKIKFLVNLEDSYKVSYTGGNVLTMSWLKNRWLGCRTSIPHKHNWNNKSGIYFQAQQQAPWWFGMFYGEGSIFSLKCMLWIFIRIVAYHLMRLTLNSGWFC